MAIGLQSVVTQAKQAARRRNQKMSTAHLLLAMFQNDRQTGVLMAKKGAREKNLIDVLEKVEEESASAIELAIERAKKIAAAAGEPAVTALHLFLAIANEPRSTGHRCLERIGATPCELRDEALAIVQANAVQTGAAGSRTIGVLPSAEAPTPLKARKNRLRPVHHARWTLSGDVDPRDRKLAPPVKPRNVVTTTPQKSVGKTVHTVAAAAPEVSAKAAQITRVSDDKACVPAGRFALDPNSYPNLCALGRNLSAAAEAGEIDPVIGRDSEIEQLLDVLARRRANNPVLVGPSGVGKTAIVEGLALRLAGTSQSAGSLSDRIIVELSVGSLVSGTGVRGALAEKLRAIKSEVARSGGRILLFVDEIHGLVGANDGGDNLAGELKASLARGELACIGATTDSEYRRIFERDAALARRFTRIEIEEPSAPQALAILQGVAPQYEKHHGVAYEPAALQAAVEMSVRYLTGGQLPDKAIGVLDRAAARVRRKNGNIVDTRAIAEVISEQTVVPIDRLLMRDGDLLLAIDRHLAQRVVGQREAISRIAPALQKSAAGFRGVRPLGTFLFLGPTGVGKTEMAKAISELLFPTGEPTRFDMSEFSESHSVARLLGAPPGYIGYEDGGQLTEAVRARPYQLVLLDEIEKAHPEVLLALLPLLDEGKLRDARGRVVDFTNAIIAMTSNLGAHRLENKSRIGFGAGPEIDTQRESLRDQALAAARAVLPPEFWNRIDEPLYFYPLGSAEVSEIAKRFLHEIADVTRERHQIELLVEPSVFEALIAAGGFDPWLGARPMRRTVGRLVEAPLAASILAGEYRAGDRVRLRGKGDKALLEKA